ncbi:MAG: hypothetical protein D6734_12170 [Candidatus Schekmanbacteria bacterium]|nr:MAG: hypothetical protein D6734_12170 [Candidatus Schekmanbacteria bacterium]
MEKERPHGTTAKVILLILFSIGFGNVEAMIVVYLRRILPPFDETTFGTVDGFVNLLQDYGIYHIEQIREMFTLLMLVTLSILVGKTYLERFAAFCISFAVWDIFYYVFLHLIIGWPTNLFDIDVLFLVPVPWVSPVILPVFISSLMIGTGIHIFYFRLKE